jgi:hypothetical protein
MIGGFLALGNRTFWTLVIPARRVNIAIEAGFVYPVRYPRPASDAPEMTKRLGFIVRRGGRVAEGGGLLNRYTV